MAYDMSVTFLGTCSGGGPLDSRNCSSLVADVLGDGSLWMVDCAEGTVRQFAQQPYRYPDPKQVKISKITKIFLTHLHVDHTMGLIPLLRNALGFPKTQAVHPNSDTPETRQKSHKPKVDLYGPRGTREFIRTLMKVTHTRCGEFYAVHELLAQGETNSVPIGRSGFATNKVEDIDSDQEGSEEMSDSDQLGPENILHLNELPGSDIYADSDGFWRNFTQSKSIRGGKITVDAGSIIHRDPCFGFIIREHPRTYPRQHGSMSNPTTSQPFDQDASEETAPLSPQIGRMLVILGDTSDASGLLPLIKPSASTQTSVEGLSDASREDEESSQPTTSQTTHTVSLLIHEATDAYIPPDIDTRQTTGKNRSFEIVEAKATEKGHSTPGMAGVFAKLIGAQRLVLNHIGSRFPAPPPPSPYHHHSLKPLDKFRLACMREIERQALETWSPSPPDHTNHTHGANKVVVAWDYCRIVVPPNVQTIHPAVEGTTENVEEVYWDAQTVKETRHGGSDGTKRAWGHHHHSQQSYSRGFHTHARGERLGDTGGRGKVETAHGARDGSYKRGRGEGRSRDEHRSDKRQRH